MLALAPPPPALPAVRVGSAWAASARATRVASLSPHGVPPAARVALSCHGGGCPFATKQVATRRKARVSLTRVFRHARLRVGARLDVRVSDTTGTLVVRFTMRSGRAPAKQRTWLTIQEPPKPGPGPPPPPPTTGPPPAGPAPGLVQYAFGQVGVALARVADDQCRAGTAVARAELLAGDVVCFADTTGYVDHVGLFAGGDQFLHAPHTGAVVGYNALSEPYYAQRFAGARRLG